MYIWIYTEEYITPTNFVLYFTNYFIRQRSLYLHIHLILLKIVEFRLCCESGCYILVHVYVWSTQICWYWRISIFCVHWKFIRLVSFVLLIMDIIFILMHITSCKVEILLSKFLFSALHKMNGPFVKNFLKTWFIYIWKLFWREHHLWKLNMLCF